MADVRAIKIRMSITAPRQPVLGVYTVLLILLSLWIFDLGVDPRAVLGDVSVSALLVKILALFCIACWLCLIVHLFQAMSAHTLSTGWCPVLLVGASAIVFLIIGCFGFAAGT